MSDDGIAYVDGRFVPIDEAVVPILDLGFLHSDATYDVVHVWNDRFFRLDDHVDRFLAGVSKLRLDLPVSRDRLVEVLHECVARSRLRHAYVEMVCTRGLMPPGSRDPRQAENRLYAFAMPFMWIADEAKQEQGIRLRVSSVERIPPTSVDPRIKNYHWLDLVSAQFEAYDQAADQPLLHDGAGNVTEGPGFNVFALIDGRLRTPERGVLHGITRRTVIEMAAEEGLAVEAGPLPIDELATADEVFITSSAGGVIPVALVDDTAIGTGVPGPVASRLRARYWELHRDPRYTTPVDHP